MKHESEMLEAERKKFEDLEFQQLEIEARMEEEREIIEQELLLEESEEEVKLRNRKVKSQIYPLSLMKTHRSLYQILQNTLKTVTYMYTKSMWGSPLRVLEIPDLKANFYQHRLKLEVSEYMSRASTVICL